MIRNLFRPADVLLPAKEDLSLWSTVACDQFTANPAYWDAVAEKTAEIPSTFHLMLPEAYLERKDSREESRQINATMQEYLDNGVFRTVENSYVYLERTLPSGIVRKGLVGALDLEHYDYSEDAISPIRATEHTVESRLPARVEIRKHAPLEMPHIMVFIDDPENHVMQCAKIGAHDTLYDFELMCGGGHLLGKSVSGTNADMVTALLDELTDESLLKQKYGHSYSAVVYAIGDGNHSLAAAKKCWDELRDTLSAEERADHPARFALVELVNIHDPGVTFHPIHRTVFGVNPAEFLLSAKKTLLSEQGKEVEFICAGVRETGYVACESVGDLIQKVNDFCQEYAQAHGGTLDYIHGDEAAAAFGMQQDAATILLPPMEKSELFRSVMYTGVFCKKSFSIGEPEEKRYYLECRKLH